MEITRDVQVIKMWIHNKMGSNYNIYIYTIYKLNYLGLMIAQVNEELIIILSRLDYRIYNMDSLILYWNV